MPDQTTKPNLKSKTPIARRDFAKLLGAAGILATASVANAAGAAKEVAKARAAAATAAKTKTNSPANSPIHATPAVYSPADDSATIIWSLNAPARGWVEYGTDARNLTQRSGGDAFGFTPHDERVLKVRLRGLAPGTRYYWRAASIALPPLAPGANMGALPTEPPPVYTPVYSFTTLAPGAAETSFAIWNDTHWKTDVLTRLADLTFGKDALGHGNAGVSPADVGRSASRAPSAGGTPALPRLLDFLLLNGDIAPGNFNDPATIADTFIHPAGVIDMAKGPPVFLARGNHDVRGRWANKLTDYIDFPDTHENRVQRPYYAFRSGPMAALVLDSGEDKPDDHPTFGGTVALEPLLAEQTRWLEKIIERPDIKNAPMKVVFCHMPLRYSEQRAKDLLADTSGVGQFRIHSRKAWLPLLAAWGVRAVISGHIHNWSHIPPGDGYPFAQITGGGPTMDQARLLRGHCTAKELRITAHTMDGREAATVIV